MSAVTDQEPGGTRYPNDEHTDPRRRPDYQALAQREGPVPESAAWNVLSYLLAGLVGFGIPGWLVDRWLGTTWVVGVGILVGTAVAMLTIWVRYGTGGHEAGTASSGSAPRATRERSPDDVTDAPDASPQEDSP